MSVVSIHQVSRTDEDLVRQIAAGELGSLGLLFDRYHLPVRRFLSRLGVPTEDLDDLVQLTFLQVPQAAVRFDPERPAKAWLFGLASYVAKRHRRSVARVARKLAALAREPLHRAPPTPADAMFDEQSAQRVRRALDALSRKKREVFVMVVLERLTGEAVAHALGIPIGTVWTRLHHARRELRRLLMEEGA